MRLKRLTTSAMALAALVGCEKVDDPCVAVDGAPATVCVEDEDGDSLEPSTLSWSFDPESTDFDGEHELSCVDPACTVWALPEEAVGEVILTATLSGPPHYSPGCVYFDSAQLELSLTAPDSASPGELVILILDPGASDCP